MNTTAPSIDLRALATPMLAKVFENMLGLTIEPSDPGPLPRIKELVMGTVGFGGETAIGAVFLHLPDALARRITGTMLGLAPE